ncbi:hypothetical protein PanWU01x14_268890 [Parasponia andersonii]|uniref:Uncharacterized protein n=1 Tax=Parasponia andersonii TaxID=3476 RepID=A0A2P5B5S9_PARAD|nr:hypothetical protein PanWU01x14_268890 [Parasponia andersonii]
MSSSSTAIPTILAIDESDDKRSSFMTSAAEEYIICLEDTELMKWSGVLKLCLFGKLIIHKPFLCVVSLLLRTRTGLLNFEVAADVFIFSCGLEDVLPRVLPSESWHSTKTFLVFKLFDNQESPDESVFFYSQFWFQFCLDSLH